MHSLTDAHSLPGLATIDTSHYALPYGPYEDGHLFSHTGTSFHSVGRIACLPSWGQAAGALALSKRSLRGNLSSQ